jgi:transposase
MDTPRSSYLTFSGTDRRHLLRALARAHNARLYRRVRAAVAEIVEGKPVAVVAKHARVERSTVYRWIERYLAERAPCSLANGKRSGRSRMTPAPTHAVQQILARVTVAAHLATYLARISHTHYDGCIIANASIAIPN